jgi:mono/diheme cytochrome c family protein
MSNCATCHGKQGDGQGPRAYFINPKPRNFLDDYSRNTLDRQTIFSSVSVGRQGTEMPGWGKVLSGQEIANVTEFVFQTFIKPNIGAKAGAK